MSTSQKRSHLNSCDLNVNAYDAEIPVCKSQKILGIIMNEVLDWTERIKDVAKRLNYSLFVLKRMKRFFSLEARIAYCDGCVLPHIDCYNIWVGTTQGNHDKILWLEKRAARIVFDDTSHPARNYFLG